MSRDHIIPQFILRGFAINPQSNKKNQKIMIYDRQTGDGVKKGIGDSFSIEDFNSKQTESFLAQDYEMNIAKLFQRIRDYANKNEEFITFTQDEYRLLMMFFVIMWRRNDIQMEKLKEISNQLESDLKTIFGKNYKKMVKPEYKESSMNDYIDDNFDWISKLFYDNVLINTKNDDPTVIKTMTNYHFFIVNNISNIHFILHNTYATLRYFVDKNQKDLSYYDVPTIMIYPISSKLCFCALYSENKIDINQKEYKIPIDVWDEDEMIIQNFIDGYITETAKYLVVDDTNIDYIKGKKG